MFYCTYDKCREHVVLIFSRAQNQQEERAKLVDDFIQRKKEAALNKMRGQEQLFGVSRACPVYTK